MGRLRNPIRIRLVGGEGGEESLLVPKAHRSFMGHLPGVSPVKPSPTRLPPPGRDPFWPPPYIILLSSLEWIGIRGGYIYIYIRNILVKDSFSSRGGHSSPRHFRVAIRLALAGETLPGGRLACTSTVFVPPVPTS